MKSSVEKQVKSKDKDSACLSQLECFNFQFIQSKCLDGWRLALKKCGVIFNPHEVCQNKRHFKAVCVDGLTLFCLAGTKMNSSSNSSSSRQNQAAPNQNNAGWCTAFAMEAIIITIGNIISILALIYMKSPRKLRRWFLVSLSIADLFVGALALPMYVYFLSASSQTISKTLSLFQFVYNAIDIFSGLASVFTLTVISLERLYAVLLPLSHRSTRRRYYMIVIGVLWCLAALISGLYWMTSVANMLPSWLFIYTMTIFSFASVGIICVVYIAVWIKIKFFLHKRSRLLGPSEERNIFIALGIVTVVFVITWLPFNILNLIANFHFSLLGGLSFNVVFFIKLLHYSNSAINPIVYSLKIPEFRKSAIALFTKSEHDYLLKTRETRV